MSEINTVEIVNKLKEKLKIKIELIKKSGIEPKLFIIFIYYIKIDSY